MKRAQGSFGSRNGASWRSLDAARARMRDARQGVSASPSEAVVAPSLQAVRDAIAADTCPFCGAGPFKSLGLHTNKSHGASAAELREMSGLKRVCSDELSDGSRDRLVGRSDFEEITRRGNLASVERGSFAVAAAASLDKRNKAAAARDPEIIALAAQEVPRHQIAARLGIAPETVRRVLDRHGVAMPMEQTNAERRARLIASQSASREARQAKDESERVARLKRFEDLGSDWAAVQSLAKELSVSTKSLTSYLRQAGVDLPDGRIATTLRRAKGYAGAPNVACRALSEDQVRLAQELRGAGLSQKAIAERLGTGQSTVSRVLRGSYVGA